MNCIYCNKETTNPKFCSRSCATKHNNVIAPKRKMTRLCSFKNCSNLAMNHNTKLCNEHFGYRSLTEKLKQTTVGEFRQVRKDKGEHPSWIHANIRNLNRSWNKELTLRPCQNCSYDKHVELCHIKAVSSFSDDALIGEVNHLDNIIQLCPNCHWELDNGLLDLSTILANPLHYRATE